MADVSSLRIDASTTAAAGGNRRLAVGALLALIAVVAAACAVWLVGGGLRSAKIDTPGAHEGTALPASTAGSGTTSAQTSHGTQRSFTAAGYVEVVPPGARIISSLIPGVLDAIEVQEGQAVRAGDAIAVIDTSLLEQEAMRMTAEIDVLRARLARLEAGYLPEEIAQAEARVQAATARIRIAEEILESNRKLVESGIVSPQLVLEAEVEAVEAVRALAEAQADLTMKRRGARPEDINIAHAELARAAADLAHTHWKLERCTIVSPVGGIVFQQLAQPGQWIAIDSGSSNGAASGAIVSIFDPKALQVWVDVNQRDLSRINIGQKVTLIADAIPGASIAGRVTQFMPRASIERNTVRVKISIESQHEGLRPDMSLRVTFHE